MPNIQTLGSKRRRTWFEYQGSVREGTRLLFTGKPFVSSSLYKAIMLTFKGKTVHGGFSMTDPITNGLGEWIRDNSHFFGSKLTPRHGSFVAAIMVDEGYIENSLKGNTITLYFPNESCIVCGREIRENEKIVDGVIDITNDRVSKWFAHHRCWENATEIKQKESITEAKIVFELKR